MSKQENVQEVAKILKIMSNETRLLMLCKLCEEQEVSASDLSNLTGISQPASSQHLAILKQAGMIDFRREHNILYYFLADQKIRKTIELLHKLYCS